MNVSQSYANHAHHPVATYVAAVFALLAMILLVGAWLFGWPTLAVGAVSLSLGVAMLVSMSRTYITRLQDRIIMLETKVRCAELLPRDRAALLDELGPKQIAALRFASDEELGSLLQRAAAEKLPPRAIKQAIKIWRPDYHRT